MAPFDGAFHQPPFWHRDAVRGPSTPSFDHIVSRPQAALGRSARFKAARTMGNLACWRKTVAHSMTPPDEPSCRIFVVPGPIKRLNRSLPREASGDDPRGQLVGMVRRRLWVDCGPSCIVRKSAAVGGFRSFADARSGDKVAPIADLPALTRVPGGSTFSGHSARRLKSRLLHRPELPERASCDVTCRGNWLRAGGSGSSMTTAASVSRRRQIRASQGSLSAVRAAATVAPGRG